MNASIRSYKDLLVWQQAIELVIEIYKLTQKLPDTEKYALSSQMRRSAVSIPSNIAEGRSRSTRKDFINFLRIALGSSAELETQLIIAEKLQYFQEADFHRVSTQTSAICRMLHGMINKLEAGS